MVQLGQGDHLKLAHALAGEMVVLGHFRARVCLPVATSVA
jgi:hypothetical protein